jgi:hypothetical protein
MIKPYFQFVDNFFSNPQVDPDDQGLIRRRLGGLPPPNTPDPKASIERKKSGNVRVGCRYTVKKG